MLANLHVVRGVLVNHKKTGYILGIARGHNAGVCLLKDGEIVFAIEEERLTRMKYDGAPLASIIKVLDYTDKIDMMIISHTQPSKAKLDYTGEDVYIGLARKIGLIEDASQVAIVDEQHHMQHANAAFYRSGFDEAAALVVDGAGSELFIEGVNAGIWEFESIFKCDYVKGVNPLYKNFGTNGPLETRRFVDGDCEFIISEKPGLVKAYEAVTEYCGWEAIEAGKTMGLFPYGKRKDGLQSLVKNGFIDRSMIIPTIPSGAKVNTLDFPYLDEHGENEDSDLTMLDNRRDLAYRVQVDTQKAVLQLIIKASEMSGSKNVVLSGGYGLNCVANYYYLTELNKLGINLYVEPISNDAGTAIGAALGHYHDKNPGKAVRPKDEGLYLGPIQDINEDAVTSLLDKYDGTITKNVSYKDVIDTIRDKNIVALYQERCENGPRALGNRSLMFDATMKDGKDFVNLIKKREYFRPFAASVLQEDVHEWFDLRGMEDSPSMMYAVNCMPGVAEKIPAVIHVDGTCRIQTVTKEQNEHWYNLINEFKSQTGVPALFNTSFNLGGEPLVETIDDAMRTLYNSGIDYMYFPKLEMMVHIPHNDRA
jgi:carbamoyltransferase